VKSGYKQTDVGVIPEGWEVERLGRFWSVTDCKHVTAQFIANGYPVASIMEVQSRYLDLNYANQTTLPFYNLLIEGGRKPRVGDLILSRNATVGEVAQVAEWHPPFAMGQDVCLLRKKSQRFSTNYLQAVFGSPIVANQFSDLMVGSTFKRVNVEQIRNLVVPMPPPAEQKVIAEVLSDADALIESLERLLAKKRQIKLGAMQQLLTGKKRLPGFSGEWEVKRLGDLASIRSGGTPSTTQSQFWNGDVLWCTPTDITALNGFKYLYQTDRTISQEGLKSSSAEIVPAGSIVMTSRATIGECAINRVPVTTNQGFKNFVPGEMVDVEYLYYLLLTQKPGFVSLCGGSTFLEIGKAQLAVFEVSLPVTVAEQSAIASVLTDMDAEIAALESRLAKTRSIKQGMMQELLTGRIPLVDGAKAAT
jgi:type I restriction enzyme S subunit